MRQTDLIACVGCGALVENTSGPTHAYVGASAGCWAVFGEVLAVRYGGGPRTAAGTAAESMFTDTYMVQHPGVPERRSSQSVWVHLVALCLALEHGMAADARIDAMRRMLAPGTVFPWLEPPSSVGPMTILDIRDAGSPAGRATAITRWAETTWAAWAPHRGVIRKQAATLDRP